jgi:hypothetical protein
MKCKNPSTKLRGLRAQERIRTFTWFPTLRPEHSASTNFATWASYRSIDVAKTAFLSFGGANIGKDKVAAQKE